MERLASAVPAVRSLRMILLAAAVAPPAGAPAHAQLFFHTWSNPGGGSYRNKLNWSPFGVPNSVNEDASFDLDAVYTVDFTSDVVAGAVTVLDGTVTFDLDVAGSYLQAPGATLDIELGPAGHGVVSVSHNVALYGTLRLTRVDAFIPGPQQTFVILRVGSLSGAKQNVANGERMTTVDAEDSPFEPSQVQLTDFASAPTPTPTPTPGYFTWGDTNGDGVAGAVDAAQILQFDVLLLDCFPIDANCDGRGPEDAPACRR